MEELARGPGLLDAAVYLKLCFKRRILFLYIFNQRRLVAPNWIIRYKVEQKFRNPRALKQNLQLSLVAAGHAILTHSDKQPG